MSTIARCREALRAADLHRRTGHVRRVRGLAIEAVGPQAAVGELCRIVVPGGAADLLAEVVGVDAEQVLLMPYGPPAGIGAGAEVLALGRDAKLPAGPALLGRVVDAFGQPVDGGPPLDTLRRIAVQPGPVPALQRPPVRGILDTGVRVIDALLTLGRGQRVGLFAGSGVGKSSLLARIARHAHADVSVIALVGERGREVREFVDRQLGPEGLARSVVVVATSDASAPARVRAAHAAVAIARDFADTGRHVLLAMDSVTRLAMARREIGLAAGEPATARGYTPSVFAELPQLCERCGTTPAGGSVTALLTVLVEGDDLNEPVADSLRAVLDGHLVLARTLAQQGRYPAIDVLQSASRLMQDLVGEPDRVLAREAIAHLALLERNRALVEIGAHRPGANPALDRALALEPALERWMRQDAAPVPRAQALRDLAALLQQEGGR
jgi:flagellum-specific ATP synthase